MKKNINIEILRSLALLLVVVYHIQCLIVKPIFRNSYASTFLGFGGELGVTMFFIISGFGIYKSIDFKKSKNDFKYKEYIKKRLSRIAVPYYFCLLIGVAMTGSAVYLNLNGLKHILTHITFTHNFFVSTHGSMNGALWTMGTFVQFYFVAPLIYKYMKKNPLLGLLVTFGITIGIKLIVFKFLSINNYPGTYYFVYGRQLITALDNFALGMFIASFDKLNITNKKINWFLLTVSFFALTFVIHIGNTKGVYVDSYLGYIWHSLLALNIALIFKIFMNFEINPKFFLNKMLLIISKYEYEIYLWHFVLVSNILGTGFIVAVGKFSTKCCALSLLLICILFGMVIAKYRKNSH